MSPEPPDELASAETTARIERSFARQGLMRLIGAEVTHVGAGCVRITLPRRDEVSQQHGYVHAGATSAIADSAGGYAALTLMPEKLEVLTVEFKLNLVAPAAGDLLEATGTVIKSGRTLSVCRIEVHAITGSGADAVRTLVAIGQQTLIAVAAATGPAES